MESFGIITIISSQEDVFFSSPVCGVSLPNFNARTRRTIDTHTHTRTHVFWARAYACETLARSNVAETNVSARVNKAFTREGATPYIHRNRPRRATMDTMLCVLRCSTHYDASALHASYDNVRACSDIASSQRQQQQAAAASAGHTRTYGWMECEPRPEPASKPKCISEPCHLSMILIRMCFHENGARTRALLMWFCAFVCDRVNA